MAEFLKFALLSIGGAVVTALILAAVAKPISTAVRNAVYGPKKAG